MVSLIFIFESGNHIGMDTYIHPSLYSQYVLLDLLCFTFGECMPLHRTRNILQRPLLTEGSIMAYMATAPPRERNLCRHERCESFLHFVDPSIRLSSFGTPSLGYLEAIDDHPSEARCFFYFFGCLDVG